MLNEINNATALNDIKNASVNENVNASMLSVIQDAIGLELVMFAFAIIIYMLFMGAGASKRAAPAKWEAEEKPRRAKVQVAPVPNWSVHQEKKDDDEKKEEVAPSPKAEPTKVDVAKHVAMIRAKSKENDLDGATQVFRSLQASGAAMTPLVYNALLDSCVQCGRVGQALQHFQEMKENSLVDVVSYNTLLKAYLRNGQVAKARALVEEMKQADIAPNQVTYNEMLNALVGVKDRKGM